MFKVPPPRREVPPNPDNAPPLCANTGSRLHLIRPLGFELDDRHLRRAGLDYHEYAAVCVHESLADCLAELAGSRVYAFTTKGAQPCHEVRFQPRDSFLFGPESCGLPESLLRDFPGDRRLRLPMLPHSRSLNLSNSVAVAVYEAWRQCGFGMAKMRSDALDD